MFERIRGNRFFVRTNLLVETHVQQRVGATLFILLGAPHGRFSVFWGRLVFRGGVPMAAGAMFAMMTVSAVRSRARMPFSVVSVHHAPLSWAWRPNGRIR